MIVLGFVVILLVVGVAWGYTVWRHNDSAKKPTASKATSVPELTQAGLLSKMSWLTSKKDYDGAIKLAKSQVGTKHDTVELGFALANVYDAKKDYVAELAQLAAMEKKFGMTASLAAAYGDTYAAMNNSKQAIAYYQKAKDLTTQNEKTDKNPVAAQEAKTYDALIKELQ